MWDGGGKSGNGIDFAPSISNITIPFTYHRCYIVLVIGNIVK